jgi:hypothetical protein
VRLFLLCKTGVDRFTQNVEQKLMRFLNPGSRIAANQDVDVRRPDG